MLSLYCTSNLPTVKKYTGNYHNIKFFVCLESKEFYTQKPQLQISLTSVEIFISGKTKKALFTELKNILHATYTHDTYKHKACSMKIENGVIHLFIEL